MGSEVQTAAEWLDKRVLNAGEFPNAHTSQELKLIAMLRDAKAELDAIDSLRYKVGDDFWDTVRKLRGWDAIERRWCEGGYR